MILSIRPLPAQGACFLSKGFFRKTRKSPFQSRKNIVHYKKERPSLSPHKMEGGGKMGLYVIFGALAAFGLLCALWAVLGSLLTSSTSLFGLCPCKTKTEALAAIRRWQWLRDMGLVSHSLILLDCGLSSGEREALQHIGPWIKIYDRDALSLSELEQIKRG